MRKWLAVLSLVGLLIAGIAVAQEYVPPTAEQQKAFKSQAVKEISEAMASPENKADWANLAMEELGVKVDFISWDINFEDPIFIQPGIDGYKITFVVTMGGFDAKGARVACKETRVIGVFVQRDTGAKLGIVDFGGAQLEIVGPF